MPWHFEEAAAFPLPCPIDNSAFVACEQYSMDGEIQRKFRSREWRAFGKIIPDSHSETSPR
jgi:hypothetical protein